MAASDRKEVHEAEESGPKEADLKTVIEATDMSENEQKTASTIVDEEVDLDNVFS